jgi:hypothetical protein
MTFSAGSRLGAYEIVAAIGAGGMGAVYYPGRALMSTLFTRTLTFSSCHPGVVERA